MSDIQHAGYDVVKNINFTGGFPTSKDLAPSAVFLVAYVITIPLLIMRLFRKSDRTIVLLRPTLFVGARVAMLIMRVIMSRRSYGIGSLIGELILTSVGYLFLIDPYIQCWRRHVEGNVSRLDRPVWLKPLAWSLWGLLVISIIITVLSGALVNKAFESQSWLTAVRGLRHAGFILSMVVVAVTAMVIVVTHYQFKLPTWKTLYLLIPTCCLVTVAVFRVVQSFTDNPTAAVRSRAAFYVLQMLFEYITYIFVIAVSLPGWYPGDKTHLTNIRRGTGGESQAGESGSKAEYPDSQPQQTRSSRTDRLIIVRLVRHLSKRKGTTTGKKNGAGDV
ncbi:hypothetical protein IAR55_002292 [Kwoniella newhampshirensis]|uniref:Chitin synthase export chaperone n=1 Tax=Kwoniella newhampshirensis TaxID=1651941 RepID=A0AAW0YR63_9TREE